MRKLLTFLILFQLPLLYAQDEMHMDHMHHMMQGFYGNYPMSREASGTSWVPESTPMSTIHFMKNDWMAMAEGSVYYIFDDQDGNRGDRKNFSESMLMFMASHPLAGGTFGFRSMFSLEPLMGKNGYPLLFQTGETADGINELRDRQHPHDLFMELALTYSHPVTKNSSVFVYAGYSGEPALGPPTFMHRFSGMYNPEAPITHHWLDSTHVTFGVATLGYIWNQLKIEFSSFTGREPDQNRWSFDKPKFDSFSWRVTSNPSDRWTLQVSEGYIHGPEQLDPGTDLTRTTASIMYNLPFGNHNWQTTFAYGENHKRPGNTLSAYLLESGLQFNQAHTLFGRYENVQKDELFDNTDPQAGVYRINKMSLGYSYDLKIFDHTKIGMGGVGSFYKIPSSLDTAYGDHLFSFMLFGRLLLN